MKKWILVVACMLSWFSGIRVLGIVSTPSEQNQLNSCSLDQGK